MAAFASSLLKVVFDKLASEFLNEFGLLSGVDKQLRKLESTLLTLQDVLEDTEARQVKEKALKSWLRKLKDVAYDSDDVLDEIAANAAKWRPKNESNKEKVRNFFPKPKSLMYRLKIAHKIKEIRERVDGIAEERSKFHLQEGVVKDYKEEMGVREQTGSFIDESEVYGRQNDREEITEFLINISSEGNIGVLAIVGLGGLGKTTVAQLVYNDERVCKHFERRIWVCVSDEFDNRRLTRSIIESVKGSECNLLDMDSMQCCLREELQGKRFLLVLDDVWNENHDKWERLRILLTCGAKGSKIIVTTRSERVASIMATVPPHFLTGLSEADCWSLFERRAFGLGGAEKTLNMIAIGREIAKKCGGVPLAAKALGSLMRFKRGESEWLTIKDSETWKLADDENEILPALKLSYNHLPLRLKQCFAYCSIFPKDHNIQKEKLVQLWMAEGFIRLSDENTHLEDVGFQYIDELLSRSLFQVDTDDVVRSVKMHDLVHDLARSVAGDECSIVDATTRRRGVSQSLRYSSFICSEGISAILEPLNQATKLRTCHLLTSKETTQEQDKGHELLHIIFSNVKLLRALHLSDCPIIGLSDSVSKLKHLRYLNLSNTHLETLPSCIGIFHNLQTLYLSHCTSLKSLPDSIGDLHNLLTLHLEYCFSLLSLPNSIGCLRSLRKLNLSRCQFLRALPESVSSLVNLQKLELRSCYMLGQLPDNTRNMRSLVHLDIHSCVGLTCMPAGIRQLNHLRNLPMYVLGGKNKSSLGELGGLNLEGELEIKNLENVRDAAEARNANLKEKHCLSSLKLMWGLDVFRKQIQACEESDDPEESLRHWIETPAAQNRDDDADFGEEVLESLQPHTNLEMLCIEGYPGRTLPKWMMELSLPNLVELSLISCFRCKHLPKFGQLRYLKALKLGMLPAVTCLGSEFYGGDCAFPSLVKLELEFMPALEDWSGVSSGEIFPCLSKLSLHDCPKLKALPSTFPFVQQLGMYVDDGLLLSTLQDGGFPNLRHLDIGNCDQGDDNMANMPHVLTERMASIENWSISTKAMPKGDDSGSMSSFGFGFCSLTAGTNIIEIPM